MRFKVPAVQILCCALIASSLSKSQMSNVNNPLDHLLHILSEMFQGYDHRIRPRGLNSNTSEWDLSPVNVFVNFYLRSISRIDDVNMEYSIHFTFREEWKDERLSFNSTAYNISTIVLPANTTIWMPDTFFQNEKDGKFHTIDKPNILIRVTSTGTVLYSVRYTLTMSCPMDLRNYPLDVQQCLVELASYAYTTSDIVYHWKEGGNNPVQLKPGLNQSLPSFHLTRVTPGHCTSNTATGAYSCLRLTLRLKREFSYYLLQLYIPSIMLVGVSWVSFWIDKDSVPARVTLGVTTLLTMTTQASGINAKLPPVSYTKAIDVWIGVCLAFIFGALAEFALVNYAARKDLMLNQRNRRHTVNLTMPNDPDSVYVESNDDNHTASGPYEVRKLPAYGSTDATVEFLTRPQNRPNTNGTCKSVVSDNLRRLSWIWKVETKSKRIDFVCRIVFPLTFIVFNVAYWVYYLIPYLNEP